MPGFDWAVHWCLRWIGSNPILSVKLDIFGQPYQMKGKIK